jgi:hypothetical protein
MWLFNKKRADLVAQSISQLIHTLAAGREHHGPTGPERLLRGLAPPLSEDTIIGQRVVKLLVAMAGKARFFVSLATPRIIRATGSRSTGEASIPDFRWPAACRRER